MKYWCRNCNDEAALAEVPIRLHPFSPPLDISCCSRCCCEVVEAGKCEYCGEPCDPDADPQLCPGCQYDLEEAINKTVQNLCDPEGGEIGTDTKINALYALATKADAMREDLERQVINANKRKAPED